MFDQKQEIEARGQDVEAAVNAGLRKLGVKREDVTIEVVDEGAKGLLGIGSRDAVVRLTLKQEDETGQEDERVAEAEQEVTDEQAILEERGPVDVEEGDVSETAESVLRELLKRMKVTATLSSSLSEPDDLTGRRINVLEIKGEDLGILIGPRGETLNALQHIARLMVGHQLRKRTNFVIDVQGYRRRREQALTRLAERMAKKVAGRHRAISLEAMPPNDRRIIHMALREHEEVYTQSTGEGNRRRVRIFPKEE